MSDLAHVQVEVASHLEEIKGLFKGPVKLTILVRRTEHLDGSQNFVVTDDFLAEAIHALKQRWDAERGEKSGANEISQERMDEYRHEALLRVGPDMGKPVEVRPDDVINMCAEIRNRRILP